MKFRVYLNKKKGNEHARFVDVDADTPEDAEKEAKIKTTEVLEQVVQLDEEANRL